MISIACDKFRKTELWELIKSMQNVQKRNTLICKHHYKHKDKVTCLIYIVTSLAKVYYERCCKIITNDCTSNSLVLNHHYIRQVSNIKPTKSQHLKKSRTVLRLSKCRIPWSPMSSQEWRCSWSSADRRCSNYIWVNDNFIAYWGSTYIRDFTVDKKWGGWYKPCQVWQNWIMRAHEEYQMFRSNNLICKHHYIKWLDWCKLWQAWQKLIMRAPVYAAVT